MKRHLHLVKNSPTPAPAATHSPARRECPVVAPIRAQPKITVRTPLGWVYSGEWLYSPELKMNVHREDLAAFRRLAAANPGAPIEVTVVQETQTYKFYGDNEY